MSVYSTQAWRQPAREWLKHNPTCIDCGNPSTQRDHTPPRRLLIAAGIHEPDHPRWWVPRCGPCHSRKTQTIDVPLLRRLDAGEPAQPLCEEAMKLHDMGWDTSTRP